MKNKNKNETMKKRYIRPTAEITYVNIEQHLLAGSGETGSHVYSDYAESGSEGFSRRRSFSVWGDDDE